jgi:Carboxypeptidase regulatory-like domain
MLQSLTSSWIALLLLQLPAAVPLQPQDAASIEGIVVDGRTNLPLSNVTISGGAPLAQIVDQLGLATEVLLNGVFPGGNAITDDEGRFKLEQIRPGTMTLGARKTGYMDFRPDGRKIPGNTGMIVTLRPGQRLQGLVLRMFPAAIVTGRVLDLKGEPVTAAIVVALRVGYDELGGLAPRAVLSVSTDDRGVYRFNNLAPGSYTFRVEKNLVRFAQGNPASFYATYYPGTRDIRNAATLPIEGGMEASLSDMTLPSGRGGNLRLRITREDRTGTQTQVVIWRPGEPNDTTSGAFQDPKGGEVGQLPPGAYQIEIETGQSRGYALVDVGQQDLEIPVHVPNPAIVVGRAGVGDPRDETRFRPVSGVRLQLLDTIANNSANRPNLVSGSDGRFTNPSVKPGLFYVQSFTVPDGMYLSAVRWGDRDVFGEKFQIDGGNIDLNVILGEGPGTIRGAITTSRGERVPGAVVALLPDDRSRKAVVVSRTSDGNGEFELKCAPGAYHLYAWSELDGAAYRNPEFMKNYDEHGTLVRIERDTPISVELKILNEVARD